MALAHTRFKVTGKNSHNTVDAFAYRSGTKLLDEKTGEKLDFRNKSVDGVDLVLPKDAPTWAVELKEKIAADKQSGVQALSSLLEAAEKRLDAQVYRDMEFSLHRELTDEQNRELALEFIQDQMAGRGMMVLANFHFDVDEERNRKPHCHVLMVTRRLEHGGLSVKKERGWNDRGLAWELRSQFCQYSNFKFEELGFDVELNPRSYAEQGIELEPQSKLGKGVVAIQERFEDHGVEVSPEIENQVQQEKAQVKDNELERSYEAQEKVGDVVLQNPYNQPRDQTAIEENLFSKEAVTKNDPLETISNLNDLFLEVHSCRDSEQKSQLEEKLYHSVTELKEHSPHTLSSFESQFPHYQEKITEIVEKVDDIKMSYIEKAYSK